MSLLLPLLLVGGLAVAAGAWLWLIARASREGVGWGLGTILLPPLGLLFALRHAQKAVGPLVLFIVGVVSAAGSSVFVTPAALDESRSPGAVSGPWSAAVAALRSDTAHEWMENRALFYQLGGVAVAATAWLWLIVGASGSGGSGAWAPYSCPRRPWSSPPGIPERGPCRSSWPCWASSSPRRRRSTRWPCRWIWAPARRSSPASGISP